MRNIYIMSVLSVLVFIAIQEPTYGESSYRTPPAREKNVIIVLDKSVSMVKNDPQRYRHEAAQLALALAKTGDHFGVITFSEDAEVIRALKEIKSASEKNALQLRGFGIVGGNMTNFMAPVQQITKMIPVKGNGTIIFLTDGDHNTLPKPADILKKIEEVGNKGWRFFSIALQTQNEKQSQLLKQMGPLTGGATFKVISAEGLINTYLKITNDIQEILQLEFKNKISFDVYPGVRRLVLVAILDPETGPLNDISIKAQGEVPDEKNTYNYPNKKLLKSGVKSKIQLVTIDAPKPGRWDINLRGKAKQSFLLEEPPFTFRIPKDMPANTHYNNQPITLGIDLQTLDRELPQDLAKNTKITVTISSESNPSNKIVDLPVPINPSTSERDGILTFRETIARQLSEPGMPEVFNVTFNIAITDANTPEFVWHHTKMTSFTLKPWEGYLQITPKSIKKTYYRSHAKLSFAIKNTSPYAVDVSPVFEKHSDLRITIPFHESPFRLKPGEEKPFFVNMEEAAEGKLSGVFRARNISKKFPGVQSASAPVEILFTHPKITIRENTLDFGAVIAGDTSLQKQITVATNVPGEPVEILANIPDLHDANGNTIGAKQIRVITPGKEKKGSKESPLPFFFSINTAGNLPNGTYKGTVEFYNPDGEFKPAKLTIMVRVGEKEIFTETKTIALSLQAGSVSKIITLQIASNTKENIGVEIPELPDLRGEGTAAGKTLPGQHIFFEKAFFQVNRETPNQTGVMTRNIPASASPGTYRGTITVRSAGCNSLEIPLQVTIRPVSFSFTQNKIDFGKLVVGQEKSEKATLVSDAESPLSVSFENVTLLDKSGNKIPVTFEANQLRLSNQKSAELSLNISTLGAKPGIYTGELKGVGQNEKPFKLIITAEVVSPSFTPSVNDIALSCLAGENSGSKTVSLSSSSPVPVNVRVSADFAGPMGKLLQKHWKTSSQLIRVGPDPKDIACRFSFSDAEDRFEIRPGTYSGKIIFQPDGFDNAEVNITLQVRPLELTPSQPEIKIGSVIYGGNKKTTLKVATNANLPHTVRINPATLHSKTGTVDLECPEAPEINIKPGQPFEINISTAAKNALPGVYRGELDLLTPDGTKKSLPVEFEIDMPELLVHIQKNNKFVPGNMLHYETIAGNVSQIIVWKISTNSLAPIEFEIEKFPLRTIAPNEAILPISVINVMPKNFILQPESDFILKTGLAQTSATTRDGIYFGHLLAKHKLGRPIKIKMEVEVGPLKYQFGKTAVNFGRTVPGAVITKEILIKTNSSRTVTFKLFDPQLTATRTSSSALVLPEIKIDKKIIPCSNQKDAVLKIIANAKNSSLGSFRGILRGIGEDNHEIQLPFDIIVEQPIMKISPIKLTWHPSTNESQKSFDIKLTTDTRQRLAYKAHVSSLSGTTIHGHPAKSLPEISSNKTPITLDYGENTFQLDINLPKDLAPGTYHGIVELESVDREDMPVVQLLFTVQMPSTWFQRNYILILSGAGLFLIIIIGMIILKRRHDRNHENET